KLTYSEVQANPAKYAGKVLELSGMVGGVVSTGNSLSIMLNLPDNNAPTLDIPASEAALIREYSTPHLRVLVRVGEGGNGNVVPLTVLAVAHDSAVHTVEAEASARAAAEALKAERR